MKWNMFLALFISVGLSSQSYGAGLLDQMLGLGCNSCGQSSCCDAEPACGCAAEPACGCEAAPACGCASEPSCGCESSCDSCCKKRCCKKKSCCRSLLSGLFSCKKSCCKKSRCCDSGCDSGCDSCGGGPAAAGDAAPMPPAPMADPAASLPSRRQLVKASAVFTR